MRGDEDDVGIYMPVFLGDYWADTGDLDCQEHGAYTQLLFRLWSAKGRLAFDPPRLAKLIHLDPACWDAVWRNLGHFFRIEDGQLTHGRVLRELEKARLLRRKKVEGGKLGAAVKKQKRNGSRSPEGHLKHTSASGSASAPPTRPDHNGEGKTRALRDPSPSLFDRVLAAFSTPWESRYGEKYSPTPAEKAQLGRMLNTLPPTRVSALPVCFERYLADESPFIAQEKRHSLGWFIAEGGWNKYIVEAKVLSPKEARGKTAAAQWLGGRNGERQ